MQKLRSARCPKSMSQRHRCCTHDCPSFEHFQTSSQLELSRRRKPRIVEQHEKNRSKHKTVERRGKLVLIKFCHNLHQQRNKSPARFKRANSNSPCWCCTRWNRWLLPCHVAVCCSMLLGFRLDSIVWMFVCCQMRFGNIGSGTCATNCCNNQDEQFKSCRACTQEWSEEKDVPANCSRLATAGKIRVIGFSWLDCPASRTPVRTDYGDV